MKCSLHITNVECNFSFTFIQPSPGRLFLNGFGLGCHIRKFWTLDKISSFFVGKHFLSNSNIQLKLETPISFMDKIINIMPRRSWNMFVPLNNNPMISNISFTRLMFVLLHVKELVTDQKIPCVLGFFYLNCKLGEVWHTSLIQLSVKAQDYFLVLELLPT